MKIKVDKNPYDRELFTNDTLVLEPNTISCLVGCNGTGKTTVVEYIKKHLEKLHAEEFEETPYSGLGKAMEAALGRERPKNKDNLYFVDFSKHTKIAADETASFLLDAAVSFSSTGEGISYRLGQMLKILGKSINKIKNQNASVFIFFDDCDAGTSLDKIIEIKDVFNLIVDHCKAMNVTYYILLTANSFEMCRDLDCISVHDFKHLKFTDYEEYKRFVLESAANKEHSFKEMEKDDE